MTDTTNKMYAVVKDTQYYHGDVQHPSGYSLKVVSMSDEDSETRCVGALDECRQRMEELDQERHYLSHGEASYHYRIVEVLEEDADYQSWLDGVDLDGCPSEDGSDYDANCAWAEQQAYESDGILPIPDAISSLVLVNLTKV